MDTNEVTLDPSMLSLFPLLARSYALWTLLDRAREKGDDPVYADIRRKVEEIYLSARSQMQPAT